ncbi:MAG TPA: crossover junction endodeoxyribonuclease RuvC [Candidatus Omnitrophota bacterium]|nr:crossover junction endodeoxyribonuclease RuvC [Candidatus Omnitrophota bacterium]HQO58558.1 crossover junction endodeoxyribonuclease RuvC [Candidatus Omnitrophota bacterium]
MPILTSRMTKWNKLRSEMKIIGIDPGLHATGYGLIEVELNQPGRIKFLEAGAIEPKPDDLLQHRINKIYDCLTGIISEYRPVVMVLERLYSHYRHPTTACKLGHVRGVICLVCAHQNIELVEHSVKRIRKNVVGDGNASKQQTREVVAHLLKIGASRLTLDASDALALALGYAFMRR